MKTKAITSADIAKARRDQAKSPYQAEARAFLERFGITFAIEPVPFPTAPPWHEAGKPFGMQYSVRLAGRVWEPCEGITAKDRKPVVFDFWGSVNDKQLQLTPGPYGVLACISGDIDTPETFHEFCDEMGLDTDSRKALETWERCADLASRLRAFFTTKDEREALAEIQ